MTEDSSSPATGAYFKRVRYRLVVTQPDGVVAQYRIGLEPISIGRSSDCDIRLDELHVSRQHCIVQQRAARLTVLDQGSTHGTILNGARIRQAQLRHGDVLRVGSTEIRVLAHGCDETMDTPAPSKHAIAAIQLARAGRETVVPEEDPTGQLGLVYRLGGLLANSADLAGAARAVIDLVLEAFPVDRVMLVLTKDDATLEKTPFAQGAREAAGVVASGPSETVLSEVLEKGKALHSLDVATDRRLSRSASLTSRDVRVVMCAPMRHGEGVLGVLYADSRSGPDAPSEDQLALFEAIADQAALALGRARLHEELVAQHELIREQRDKLDALSRGLERRVVEKNALAEERAIALAERLAELEQLQEARETMAQCLVHDVRNMVGAVDLSLQYLAMAVKGNVRAEEAATEAQEVGSRILSLVEDVLADPRMETGVLELEPKLVDVGRMFSAAVRRNSSLARDKDVTLSVGEVPPGTAIVADPSLLDRILDNLIGNALRYAGPTGSVTLSARPVDGAVELVVTDSGPGVRLEERELVFEKWYQSTSRSAKHHGLGLHFCQLAAEAHGGTIRIAGGPGENSFVVAVPARSDLDDETTM